MTADTPTVVIQLVLLAAIIPAESHVGGKILKPISIPELVAGIERICLRTQRPDDDALRLAPESMKARRSRQILTSLRAISARKQPDTHIGLRSYCADLS